VQNKISLAKANLISEDEYILSRDSDSAASEKNVAAIYALYNKKLKENNALDFDDIIYLAVKLLKSSDRVLKLYQSRFKYLLVDEYQDINYSQYVLIKTLSSSHKNICVVGDDDQCVAANVSVLTPSGYQKIENFMEGSSVVACAGHDTVNLSQVDKVMRKPYSGKAVRVTLENGKSIVTTPNHLFFAKYNGSQALIYVYLMYRKTFGYKIGVCQGLSVFTESRRHDLEEGDKVWIMKICKNPKDAYFYESFYATKYGIPTLHFSSRSNRVTVDQEKIDYMYKEIDTFVRAEILMKDLMLYEEHPHYISIAKTRSATSPKVLSLTMFGSTERTAENGWFHHRVNIDVNSQAVNVIRAAGGASIRSEALDKWKIEAVRQDYTDVVQFAKTISGLDDLLMVEKAQLTSKPPFYQMPASHLHEQMILPYFNHKETRIEELMISRVEVIDYEGFVYDLSVKHLHNYMVDGFIVHNSIYSWRGADVRSILNFEKDYPGASVVKLEQNYRSTKNILLAASEVIKNNMSRREKTLWTSGDKGEKITIYEALNEQAEVIFAINQMRQVIYREDKKYSDFAFFYRTNAQSRIVEETLIKEGIPYKMVGSVKFYQRKEIKDILSYLRLVLNTKDNVSLKRILNVPRRGIGEKSINSLISFAEQMKISIFEALSRVTEIEDLPLKAKNTTLNFVDLINELREDAKKCNVTELTRNILEKTGYLRELKVINSSQTVDRSKNVNEFLSLTETFDEVPNENGLSGFLERVTLITDLDEIDDKENAVTLMTFHSAKGLEFPVVFMFGMEEKLFPHEHSSDENFDIAEERRLCYVGMTRARERLYLVHTRQRRIFGSVFTNPVSRFVSEIPESLVLNISCEEEFLNSIPQMTRQKPVFHADRDETYQPANYEDDAYGSKDIGSKDIGSYKSSAVSAVAARIKARISKDEPQSACDDGGAEFGGVSFNPGDRVKHSMWGIGVVLDANGRGDECLVKVNFMNVGEKKLLLKYAPLDKI
ncbi:MAG TPA: 3'-5' exonuclease, partial [Candidatus Wallbacteria bacterium]|nr:3'-5' exonuclease [Candidatus Wallbacteria bacterium]